MTSDGNIAPLSVGQRRVLQVLLIIAPGTWGVMYPINDYINTVRTHHGVGLWDVLWLRLVPAALLVLPLLWVRRAEARRQLSQNGVRIGMMGLITIFGYSVLQLVGQEQVGPAVAAVVIALEPSLAFLMSVAARLEKATTGKILGLLVSIAGLAVMTVGGGLGRATGVEPSFWYLVAIFVAPSMWAAATVLGKDLADRHDPMVMAALTLVLGAIPVLPAPFIAGTHLVPTFSAPAGFWWCTIYMVLIPSVGSVLLWYGALRYMDVSRLSAYLFLTPVYGMVASAFRAWPAGSVVVGGLVVLLGVVITEWNPKLRVPRGRGRAGAVNEAANGS